MLELHYNNFVFCGGDAAFFSGNIYLAAAAFFQLANMRWTDAATAADYCSPHFDPVALLPYAYSCRGNNVIELPPGHDKASRMGIYSEWPLPAALQKGSRASVVSATSVCMMNAAEPPIRAMACTPSIQGVSAFPEHNVARVITLAAETQPDRKPGAAGCLYGK